LGGIWSWIINGVEKLFGLKDKKKVELPKKIVPVKQIPINKFEWKPLKYEVEKQYIYLTFDDGPQNGTEACLELCKKLNVKATFFMVGKHADGGHLKEIVKNIRESYPQILLANHSTTHANGKYRFFYHHPSLALNDFLLAQKTLDVPYKIIRLPGNSAWINSGNYKASGLVKPICSLLDSCRYSTIGWDAEWRFSHKSGKPIQRPQTLANQVDSAFKRNHTHTQNHLVILSHDRMFKQPNYLDSLSKFIQILKKNPKNVFETVDHYPTLNPKDSVILAKKTK
jgi:peptidoglycan/xylan/chitin deacetylase (PgdA/CDA1 family)